MKLLPFDYAVRNLGRSPTRLFLCGIGATLVVFLIVGAAAFVRGMSLSLADTGDLNNVIILGTGSEESLERSQIDMRAASVTAASLEVRTRLGVPFVSPEVHLALAVKTDPNQEKGKLTVIRGVRATAYLVHSQVQVVAGHAPQAGQDEVMIGTLVPEKLDSTAESLGLGDELWIDGRPWSICGLFAAPRTVMDAEIWMPLSDLQVVAQRDTLSCVILSLDPHSGSDITDAKALAAQRIDLEITAMSEAEYYKKLSQFYAPIRVMIIGTSFLIALGALLGGINTMYAAFAARVREVGSLQTLGYGRTAIVVSLLQESLITACAGALLASLLALLLLDGTAVRFSMGAFGLVVDAPVLTVGVVAGILVGIIGALPPAVRCLRLPIHVALKA